MLKVILLFICFTISTLSVAQDGEYHEVKPRKGDGVLSILRRYHLEKDGCNIKTFYMLNGMKKGDGLKGHKKYKIPVQIFKFNGKTIRSSVGISDFKQALDIQKYNERIRKEGLRKKSFKTSKILWVPQHLLGCDNHLDKEIAKVTPSAQKDESKKNYKSKKATTAIVKKNEPKKEGTKVVTTQPTTKKAKYGYKTEKLLGKKFQKVPVLDQTLKGHVYYITSGHGGPDSGARCVKCPKTMCEDEYAYDIGLRLGRILMEHGAVVNFIVEDKNDGIRDDKYLKCDKDERVNGKKMPINQKRRLNQRVARINKLYRQNKKKGYKKQVAVFLHVDSQSAHRRQDVFFYHHKNSKTGKKICQNMSSTLKKKYDQYQKGRGYKGHVSPRGLYVINYTQPTTVFTELANIRNRQDHKRLILSRNREILANWLYQGLTK